jgi:hypothetical protein
MVGSTAVPRSAIPRPQRPTQALLLLYGASKADELPVGGESAEGEEGPPETVFGGLVAESWSEGGQPESVGTLGPGKPGAFGSLRERLLRQRVAKRIYGVGGGGTDCHQSARFEGEYLLQEARVRPNHVSSVELYGGEAAFKSIRHLYVSTGIRHVRGSFRDQHDAGEGIAKGLWQPDAGSPAGKASGFMGGLRLVVSHGGAGRCVSLRHGTSS